MSGDYETALEDLRQQCLDRGLNGIMGLGILFRKLDRDQNRHIAPREFLQGLKQYGLTISEECDTTAIFAHFDQDGDGRIDFHEFLRVLRPPLSAARRGVITEVFRKLDASGDGILTVADLTTAYAAQARKHPKVVEGRWTETQALQSFISSFDTPGNEDGQVTLDEFFNYYSAVSCTVESDQYFDMMMRNCWGLRPRGTSAE